MSLSLGKSLGLILQESALKGAIVPTDPQHARYTILALCHHITFI